MNPRLTAPLLFLCLVGGCASHSTNLTDQVDAALDRATTFLISRQSPDGAWRSNVYGFFKDGSSLTGHVAFGVCRVGGNELSAVLALQRARVYLQSIAPGVDTQLNYPVYTAADAVRVLTEPSDPAAHAAALAWLKFLRCQQLNESLGWQQADVEYGGWSFAIFPPAKPAPGRQREVWDFSNLSATRYALDALTIVGVPPDQAALLFVRRCQNFIGDGGFFFSPADSLHNKAGAAGRDAAGNMRYNSYGSMTVDGIDALLDCGLPATDSRILAAVHWLQTHPDVEHNPGDFGLDVQDIRDATYFYYCRGLADLYVRLPGAWPQRRTLAARLAKVLLQRQRSDGSWSNSFTDAKEDDPLVATPLAGEALENCRQILGGRQGV